MIREESDIRFRADRIGKYFRKYLSKFIFVEFSEDFIIKSKAGDLMRNVSIPLKKEEVQDFAGGDGISMSVIAQNMAWVMGCDPHFKYTEAYAAILSKLYDDKIHEGMLQEGMAAAEKGDMDNACIHFRASLCMKYDYLDGMYSYARACRAMYLNSSNEEYVGRFKAETLDWLELLTEEHPEFAQGYYYLGYAYLNLGLYSKADIAWKKFMKLSRIKKDKKEIRDRLNQISEPIRIEEGCNHIMAGRYDKGIELLEPFLSSRFKDWWPLHYYLGVAYEIEGRRPEAINELKRVLQLNGSHLETMKELLAIYTDEGDNANIEKYSRKIQMIQLAMEEDQQQFAEQIRQEDEKLQQNEPEFIEPEIIDLNN